jgi:hypothetical protein
MKIEVLNTIKRKGEKWEYNGKFYFNKKWIPTMGTVSSFKTEAQYKKAIIKQIKLKADKYKAESEIPQEMILAADSVFKEVI